MCALGAAPTAVIRGPTATGPQDTVAPEVAPQDTEVRVAGPQGTGVQEAEPPGIEVLVAAVLREVQDTAVPVAVLHHGVQVLAGARVVARAAQASAEVPEAQV